MESRITLVTLGVSDLERSLSFYRDGLELRPSSAVTDEVAFIDMGGVVLALYLRDRLAEVGFSILNAIRLDNRREFVVIVEPHLRGDLVKANSTMTKESLRTRALVAQHLKQLALANLYVVDTLEEMLEVSISLYRSAEIRHRLVAYTARHRLGPHPHPSR
jgi:hypothetical protein